MPRRLALYSIALLLFAGAVGLVFHAGVRLGPAGRDVPAPASAPPATAPGTLADLLTNLHHPLSSLLLQVIVVLSAARLLGRTFRRFGQPAVVGEMAAGILLGPSLLGTVAPAAQDFLFPPPSIGALELLAQIGVVLFMFVVGLELDTERLRGLAHTAVVVSQASIAVPFLLGTAASLWLYPRLAPPAVPFAAFALFMGAAMSVTAFPVLARILAERGLSRTRLGTLVLACAAAGDVTAWCLLAAVAAVASAGGMGGAALTVLLSLAFIAVMILALRPRAARFLGVGRGVSDQGLATRALLLVFAAALATEAIGVHALFGGFLAGVVMPGDRRLRHLLGERVGSFGTAFLLPLFFAVTGLRTELGRLDDAASWLAAGSILAVAVAGKLGGSLAAARWVGMGWREAIAVGALMNTRGLLELVVLNLGFEMGILPARVFAMMVLMAIATTCMAGPILGALRVGGDPTERCGAAADEAR